MKYAERNEAEDAVASVGSKGDSFDNAIAEALNSLFKAELVRNKGPWRDINHLEFAVASGLIGAITGTCVASLVTFHLSNMSRSKPRLFSRHPCQFPAISVSIKPGA